MSGRIHVARDGEGDRRFTPWTWDDVRLLRAELLEGVVRQTFVRHGELKPMGFVVYQQADDGLRICEQVGLVDEGDDDELPIELYLNLLRSYAAARAAFAIIGVRELAADSGEELLLCCASGLDGHTENVGARLVRVDGARRVGRWAPVTLDDGIVLLHDLPSSARPLN